MSPCGLLFVALSQHDNTFRLDSLNSAFSEKTYCWALCHVGAAFVFPYYFCVCVHTLCKCQYMCVFTEKKARKIELHLIGLGETLTLVKSQKCLHKLQLIFNNLLIIVLGVFE